MKTRLYVCNPVEGYVMDEVSRVPTALANLSQEFREKFVTDLAAVSRGGGYSKNPAARFKALLKEAAPNSKDEIVEEYEGSPSRPLEFLPVIVEFKQLRDSKSAELYWVMVDDWELDENYEPDFDLHLAGPKFSQVEFFNKVLRFSYSTSVEWDDEGVLVYTNARTLINAGFKYEEIPCIGKITYRQYGNSKDDLHIVLGGRKVSVYDIPVDYEVLEKIKDKPLLFNVKDLLNSGYDVIDICSDYVFNHCYVDNRYSNFKAIKLKVPMFIWAQWPMTHTRLSKESQSDRVAEGSGYWLPEDLVKRIREFKPSDVMSDREKYVYDSFRELQFAIEDKTLVEDFLSNMLEHWSQNLTQDIFKMLGYKREIFSRAPYYFKYKECVVTGWYNDTTTWQHSFLERSVEPESWKNWTQKETKEVLEVVKKIIESK